MIGGGVILAGRGRPPSAFSRIWRRPWLFIAAWARHRALEGDANDLRFPAFEENSMPLTPRDASRVAIALTQSNQGARTLYAAIRRLVEMGRPASLPLPLPAPYSQA